MKLNVEKIERLYEGKKFFDYHLKNGENYLAFKPVFDKDYRLLNAIIPNAKGNNTLSDDYPIHITFNYRDYNGRKVIDFYLWVYLTCVKIRPSFKEDFNAFRFIADYRQDTNGSTNVVTENA